MVADLQAAVMATCKPGDTLLLARNCHAAAFSAMVLTGANVATIDGLPV